MVETYYEYDGTPHLVMNFDDLMSLPENVTKTPPPNGIYKPYYYDADTDTLHGSTEDEFLESLEKEEPLSIIDKDNLIMQLSLKSAEQDLKITQL
ncbi:hypothetical protein MUA68_14735 (plasmid) [Staphylococcus aureus]|uniref:hypothetical protein n=1 Tax=Staphylococcus aureus TaxID=1280 RepID=UPI0021D0B5F8|nr:hypothetical protein [Staphylococcus aureus]UXV54425.1 hypothetical protein MUA78_14315 [Staphylococcus aureus]UXV57098.1 hypothetical protein MUA68_14735 [Staphylococcus aureus]